MSNPIITLTTDFGEGSFYVAQMKGVALSIHRAATLIDITHSIRPQSIRHGAVVLADVAEHFPSGTIHVGVVDPGVGTNRKIVYAEIGDQRFVAPDNGLLSLLARQQPVGVVIGLDVPEYWQREVSATFHGRDIMVSVAAHLARGVDPERLGRRCRAMVQLDWAEARVEANALCGIVVLVDGFGNLITNIRQEMLPDGTSWSDARVTCGKRECGAPVETYGKAKSGTVIALFGSSGRLEIALTNGNAAQVLDGVVGTVVEVRW